MTPPVVTGNLDEQIDQAFHNIHLALQTAGGQGIAQVFKIRSYHARIETTPDAMELMEKNFAKWFPDHRPVWTAVGIERLAMPEMLVEIEAVAYDPKA